MELQINKEIRNYKESVFFGLSLRQCICSVAAIAVSAISYVVLAPRVGVEITSWVCLITAAPFAALGFVRYHGMSAEKLFWAVLRTVIEPRRLGFSANNLYYEATKSIIEKRVKEEKNTHEPVEAPSEKQ